MKGDKKVIEYLNQVLSIELTSINQYFLHARMFKNWGLARLDEREYKKSIKDMKQADALIERILFLEGLPNLQHLNRLRIGEHTAEMLECDRDQVAEQLVVLKEAIAYCESVRDYVSRELLCELEEYEEAHLDWIDTQLDLIGKIGIENYQQSQL
ncbi:bacterioferritin [Zobellella taiwanensis]|jgi:bacterioferritin|uniref:Bacterioferritin n=1 Tax=Zobellella taiwanensis TaxID=347535 RepID=A0A2P7R498_9GAMM|nr:bacterioferritin [Zobellella taiwanensis]PSJ45018.1 bacterioferritin [Zobellella taiwanensis]